MIQIQEMKDGRDQMLAKMDKLQSEMVSLETALESKVHTEQDQIRELQGKHSDHKREFDSLDLKIHILNQKIHRRENLVNCESLMASYQEAMSGWKADEHELNEKRESLSSRLEQIRQQAVDNITKARQAETAAASAYAQAVAWGDIEREKAATVDAQKAAKNLITATENNRRQDIIIEALEQEIVTVERYITEAQREHKKIEISAIQLACTCLEEKWNSIALQILEVGAKLYTARELIGLESLSLMKLNIPELGENNAHWRIDNIYEKSTYNLSELLKI